MLPGSGVCISKSYAWLLNLNPNRLSLHNLLTILKLKERKFIPAKRLQVIVPGAF